jgi:hypothetical protein
MGAALAAFLSFATLTGCDNNDAPETVLSGDRCGDACQRYATCYDASFDVASCTSRCEAAVADSSVSVETTSDCLSCIGDAACGSGSFTCAVTCAAVIVL